MFVDLQENELTWDHLFRDYQLKKNVEKLQSREMNEEYRMKIF